MALPTNGVQLFLSWQYPAPPTMNPSLHLPNLFCSAHEYWLLGGLKGRDSSSSSLRKHSLSLQMLQDQPATTYDDQPEAMQASYPTNHST
jgi:hypothetical protein